MSDLWSTSTCGFCNTSNWICYGDLSDPCGRDEESFECYKCGKLTWLLDEEMRELADIEGPIEDSYSTQGYKDSKFPPIEEDVKKKKKEYWIKDRSELENDTYYQAKQHGCDQEVILVRFGDVLSFGRPTRSIKDFDFENWDIKAEPLVLYAI